MAINFIKSGCNSKKPIAKNMIKSGCNSEGPWPKILLRVDVIQKTHSQKYDKEWM